MRPDETIGEPVKDAMRRVFEAGHEVTLATGRSWENVRDLLVLFGIRPRFVVCSNGAVIMQRKKGEYRRAFVETFDARPVLERIRPYLPQGSFMVEDADGTRHYTQGMDTSGWVVGETAPVSFDELGLVPASRVVVVSPSHDAEEFLRIVETMGLHQVTYSVGWAAWLDIAPQGVSKGSALERVRAWLAIPASSIVVIGDGRNDIEMFDLARASGGRAVAMGQSPDEVKAAATEVTGDVDDDGVATVLESLL